MRSVHDPVRNSPENFEVRIDTQHFDMGCAVGVMLSRRTAERRKAVKWGHTDDEKTVARKLRELADWLENE